MKTVTITGEYSDLFSKVKKLSMKKHYKFIESIELVDFGQELLRNPTPWAKTRPVFKNPAKLTITLYTTKELNALSH